MVKNKMEKIVIPRGKHKYKLLYCRLPSIYPKVIKKSFMFSTSCMYDFKDNDQHDVNKLFGMSLNYFPTFKKLTPHHNNSVRFGWRPKVDLNLIQIVAYEYLNAQRRPTKIIANVKMEEWYSYNMFVSKDMVFYTIVEEEKPDNVFTYISNYVLKRDKLLGYELDVYFGGNRTAPHDITLYKK